MFIQRKIEEELFGNDVMKVSSQMGYFSLQENIVMFGESHDYTSLRPYLVGVDPDDSFSEVPYEKGYNFFYFLEDLINKAANEDLFRIILRRYLEHFKYKTVTYDEFKNFIEKQISTLFDMETALKIVAQINWSNWMNEPGFPQWKNNFTSVLITECEQYLKTFMSEGDMTSFDTVFKGWHEYQRQYFLKILSFEKTAGELTDKQYAVLNETLHLGEGWNAEITYAFFSLMLLNKKTDDASLAMLDKFLAANGRIKYLRPLYTGLAKINKGKAIEMFNKYKQFYHSVTVRLIEIEFNKII
jgi:leukotriene-A4 hydrolase